jgi:chemotaxis protein methyltransferase CheR
MNALDLAPFQALVKERCGLQCEGDGQAKLAQALQERCAHLRMAPMAYYQQLVRSGAEFQALVNLLTINETYFFREPEQIDLLVQRLAPRALARHAGHAPVRILSAGCSSGEEPYSLAMALLEKYGDSTAQLFELVAGDIDTDALAKARAGVYGDFSFRGVSDAIRQRYFEPHPQGQRLREDVRRLVRLYPLNLLDSEAPQAVQDCDIIFFRNVSIYFDAATRRRIQQNLARLLRGDGVLVIGSAETLANDLGVLRLVEEAGLFYFTPGPAPQAGGADSAWQWPPAPVPMPPRAPAPPPAPLRLPTGWGDLPELLAQPQALARANAPAESPAEAPAALALAQARQAVQDKHYAQALPLLDAALAAQPGSAEARLLKAYVLLERKDFDTAQALAQQVLDADPWSVDACMLLGLAAKWRGQGGEAIRWLRQAIYAHHACWPAHYFLADLLREGGALEQARRSWRVVVQMLSGATPPQAGLRYLPLELPAHEIRFLCERQLAQAAVAR